MLQTGVDKNKQLWPGTWELEKLMFAGPKIKHCTKPAYVGTGETPNRSLIDCISIGVDPMQRIRTHANAGGPVPNARLSSIVGFR
jgi:hypothetical protein